jgi:hypothetical protein
MVLEGLEEAGGVKVLRFVPLVCSAGAHNVSDERAASWHMEVGAQMVQCLGDAFVPRTMGHRECLPETW